MYLSIFENVFVKIAITYKDVGFDLLLKIKP